jgi:hypothetical protein
MQHINLKPPTNFLKHNYNTVKHLHISNKLPRMISVFHRTVVENCTLLGYYAMTLKDGPDRLS